MFRHSKIFWGRLLVSGAKTIFKKYQLKRGVLVIDDTDKTRAKITSRIFKTHKIYNTKTSGYFNGQSIVFLLLVTNKISIPVGFKFYHPDPVLNNWEKNDKELKKAGIVKKDRPARPKRDPKYPSKSQLSRILVKEFK
ncbi:MAG: hypothetical protein HQK49_22300 [Oligoflexia bacterium]|nr:hypothetical protein [Oligoflexia bacterium]